MSEPGSKFKTGDKVLCVELPRHRGKTTTIKVGDRAILEKCKTKREGKHLLVPTHRWRIYRKGSKKKTKKTYCYWEHDNECYVLDGEASLEARIRIESQILGGGNG